MNNKRVLSKVDLGSFIKPNPYKKDIIYDPRGQWDHPGENTRIPGGDITMQGVDYPVWAQPSVGPGTMMQPGQDYTFPGAEYVDEYPQMKKGGSKKKSSKYTRNIFATNKLFVVGPLFKKPKKNQIFDPNASFYQDGGEANDYIETELTDDEIQAYRDGGYVVEESNEYKKGGALLTKKVTCKKCGWTWDAADGGDDVTTCHKCGGQGLVHAKKGGETSCPEGYAFNPKTGECIEWKPTVWNSEDQPTSYDPVGDIVYMNPNDRPEGMSDEEYAQMYQDQIEHEQLHRLQWVNGDLKGQSGTPLRMPSTVDNQEYDGEHYYNRRGEEENNLHNQWNQHNPELAKFLPNDLIYNKEINPVMYELPWTEEGEARGYEYNVHGGMPSFFPKKKKGGAYYDDSRDAWVSANGTVGPNGPAYAYGGDISIPTLNQAQEGGEDPVPLDPHQAFLKNWYENRVFPKELEKARPILLEQLSKPFPEYVPTDRLPADAVAAYNYDDNIVETNKNYPAELIEGSKTHEDNHYVTRDANEYLNGPHGHLVEQNIIKPKDINTGNPEWDKAYKKNFEDIVAPEEMHSRIMTFRELAGFKPNQVITEKDVEDYFKKAGDKLDPDIQDIKQVTKGTKSIVELLNYMASNDGPSKDNIMDYAKNGGIVTSLTQKQINEYIKNGYIVESLD